MSDYKKQKDNWRLLLVGVVLGSVITFGAFRITSLDLNKGKNLVINAVEYFLTLESGFGETQVVTTSTKKDDKTTIINQTHPRKTLWDWLELSSRLLVPILIFSFGLLFQKRDKEKEKAEQERREKEQKDQAELEREIAKDNRAEEAIQTYLDNIAELLLDKELRSELFANDQSNSSDNDNKDNPVINVARTQTITILRRLEGDTDRQNRIINFLRDAGLHKFILKNASLSGINLSQADLRSVNLEKADLRNADLEKAYPIAANLENANLQQANLENAVLIMANLKKASLRQASLKKADLRRANLQQANLQQANLQQADLIGAENLTPQQIKKACLWDKAIYKGELNGEKALRAVELDNTNYIEQLKKDKSSDPKESVNCSRWSR